MTEAERTELAKLEGRMDAIIAGHPDPDFGSEQAARLCELMRVREYARTRDEELRRYETGAGGFGVAQTIARSKRGRK
jgi:hypothetical protein